MKYHSWQNGGNTSRVFAQVKGFNKSIAHSTNQRWQHKIPFWQFKAILLLWGAWKLDQFIKKWWVYLGGKEEDDWWLHKNAEIFVSILTSSKYRGYGSRDMIGNTTLLIQSVFIFLQIFKKNNGCVGVSFYDNIYTWQTSGSEVL